MSSEFSNFGDVPKVKLKLLPPRWSNNQEVRSGAGRVKALLLFFPLWMALHGPVVAQTVTAPLVRLDPRTPELQLTIELQVQSAKATDGDIFHCGAEKARFTISQKLQVSKAQTLHGHTVIPSYHCEVDDRES